MELEKLLTLIKTVSDSSLKSFTFEEENMKISMDKESYRQILPSKGVEIISERTANTEILGRSEGNTGLLINDTECGNFVKSPLVGTFYSSPSPDVDNYVNAGDKVKKGQILGIIEAMKLMNDIESDFEGEIVDIMVSNENMVEYGQPLFKIK